jgi:hypothetical protein
MAALESSSSGVCGGGVANSDDELRGVKAVDASLLDGVDAVDGDKLSGKWCPAFMSAMSSLIRSNVDLKSGPSRRCSARLKVARRSRL